MGEADSRTRGLSLGVGVEESSGEEAGVGVGVVESSADVGSVGTSVVRVVVSSSEVFKVETNFGLHSQGPQPLVNQISNAHSVFRTGSIQS